MSIFVNDPFEKVDEIFKTLYQDKRYIIVWSKEFGQTISKDAAPGKELFDFGKCFDISETDATDYDFVIMLSIYIPMCDLVGIMIHELAHTVDMTHGDLFVSTVKIILDEYLKWAESESVWPYLPKPKLEWLLEENYKGGELKGIFISSDSPDIEVLL